MFRLKVELPYLKCIDTIDTKICSQYFLELYISFNVWTSREKDM